MDAADALGTESGAAEMGAGESGMLASLLSIMKNNKIQFHDTLKTAARGKLMFSNFSPFYIHV